MTVTSAPGARGPLLVYAIAITGSAAMVTKTTTVTTDKNIYTGQTLLYKKTFLGAGKVAGNWQDVFIWSYPKGGAPTSMIGRITGERGPNVSGMALSTRQ